MPRARAAPARGRPNEEAARPPVSLDLHNKLWQHHQRLEERFVELEDRTGAAENYAGGLQERHEEIDERLEDHVAGLGVRVSRLERGLEECVEEPSGFDFTKEGIG